MSLRTFAIVAGLFVVGCAPKPTPSVTPADHPANPRAAEMPVPSGGEMLTSPNAATRDHAATKPTTQAAVYACPMHPQVTSAAPGECPICHMTLKARGPHDHPKGAAQ